MSANKFRGYSRECGAVVLAVFLAISAKGQQPATHDVTSELVSAGVTVEGLRAVEVGGILVLRGRAIDQTQAEHASVLAQTLGHRRVANLIQVAGVPDDARIARSAERELARHRGLDGAQIVVVSSNGVVRLSGTVSNDLQKEIAVHLVRNIDGVRNVQTALKR